MSMKLSFLVAIIISFTSAQLDAQWLSQGAVSLPPNFYVASMKPLDQNVVWAVADTIVLQGPTASSPRILRTIDGGDTWEMQTIPQANGMFFTDITAIDANIAWVAVNDLRTGDGGIYKTIDGGVTWIEQLPHTPCVYLHFFNAHDGLQVNRHIIHTSTDGGATWVRVAAKDYPEFFTGEYMIFYASNNAMAITGDNVWIGTSRGRVFHSSDRGHHWSASETSLPSDAAITSIAFKDSQHGIVVSCLENVGFNPAQTRMSRTSDGGQNWETIVYQLDGPSGACIAYIPGARSTYMMVASAIDSNAPGAAYSNDDGSTWDKLDDDNHNSIAFVDPATGWTSCETTLEHPNGFIQKWAGSPLSTTTRTVPNPPDLPSLDNHFPEPASTLANISFTLPHRGAVYLAMYDILGQRISLLTNGVYAAGCHTLKTNLDHLKTGIYFYRMICDGVICTRKLTVVK
ncbi:hypothetical protein KQI65_15865 [bacterium]|nr:hypothetical protein [bacterium]